MESKESVIEHKTIYELMGEVSRSIGAIAKARKTESGARYSFRGIDDVFDAIHDPLSAAGIITTSKVIELNVTERVSQGDGGKDRYQTIVVLTKQVRFIGPRGDVMETEGIGEAQDYGDKAVAKAESIAFRTAMIQAFTIPINDPDTKIDTETDNSPRTGATRVSAPPTRTTRVQSPITKSTVTTSVPNMRRLFALINGSKDVGKEDSERHTWASAVLGREVTSFTELNSNDVSELEGYFKGNNAASAANQPTEYADGEEPF